MGDSRDRLCKHEGESVLLVEGTNDCHVILGLCAKHTLPETFGIYECGSDVLAIKRLNALISSSEPPRVIGLVIDADDPDLSGRWAAIRGKLSNYDYVLPERPSPEGTVVEPVSEVPRLGFWLMPNNQQSGMMEDFYAEMIGGDTIAIIRECIELARTKGVASFRMAHYSKAIVHTFLALQDEPGKPMGQAINIESIGLRFDAPTVLAFLAWLNRLFSPV